MNAQEAILKIKALFEDNEMPKVEDIAAPVETKVEMAEYSLTDGTKVMISSLEVGGEVKLVDGTLAPAGEHQLADGTNFQLDENGIIVEISTPAEDAIPEEEMVKAEDKKLQEMVDEFNAKIEELKAEKEIANKKVELLESKVKEGFAEVAKLVEALANTPTADPIQKPNSFNSFVSTKSIKEERLEKYRNAILNTKN